MIIAAETPDEYFGLTGDREADLRELDSIIRTHAPDLDRAMVSGMSINMVGYGMSTYKNARGKTQQWPVLALANQKRYISLYICAVIDGEYVAERYADRLGKVTVGKSCIRFKNLNDLNLETIKEIVRTLQERVTRGETVFGVME